MNFPGDSHSFRAVIHKRTDGGAYVVEARETKHKTFVPARQCIVAPETFAFGQEVEITLSRSLAREKGFLREVGPGQGRLL